MLRKSEWPQSMRNLHLFQECSAAELRKIAPLVTMITVEPGTVLMREGTIGLEFVVITDGVATVSVGSGSQTQVLAELATGDFVGEMSLLGRDRRSATVTAKTQLTFYVSNTAEFSSLLEAAPSVGHRIVAAAAERAEANAATLRAA